VALCWRCLSIFLSSAATRRLAPLRWMKNIYGGHARQRACDAVKKRAAARANSISHLSRNKSGINIGHAATRMVVCRTRDCITAPLRCRSRRAALCGVLHMGCDVFLRGLRLWYYTRVHRDTPAAKPHSIHPTAFSTMLVLPVPPLRRHLTTWRQTNKAAASRRAFERVAAHEHLHAGALSIGYPGLLHGPAPQRTYPTCAFATCLHFALGAARVLPAALPPPTITASHYLAHCCPVPALPGAFHYTNMVYLPLYVKPFGRGPTFTPHAFKPSTAILLPVPAPAPTVLHPRAYALADNTLRPFMRHYAQDVCCRAFALQPSAPVTHLFTTAWLVGYGNTHTPHTTRPTHRTTL